MSRCDDCYTCKYKQAVPGNAHIACRNPDPLMQGDLHGVRNGWFIYPLCFDPAWKARECRHYLHRDHVFPQTAEEAQQVVELIATMDRADFAAFLAKTTPHVEETPYFGALARAVVIRVKELVPEADDARPR